MYFRRVYKNSRRIVRSILNNFFPEFPFQLFAQVSSLLLCWELHTKQHFIYQFAALTSLWSLMPPKAYSKDPTPYIHLNWVDMYELGPCPTSPLNFKIWSQFPKLHETVCWWGNTLHLCSFLFSQLQRGSCLTCAQFCWAMLPHTRTGLPVGCCIL